MKKFVKIFLAVLILAMTLSLCSCDITESAMDILKDVAYVLEDMIFTPDYNFSDVVLTQKGMNEFEISFTADTGADDVKVYVNNSFRNHGKGEPEKVSKTVLEDGRVSYRFTKELPLGEDQYLWVVCGDKEAMTAFTVPSAFPTVTLEGDKTIFHFSYTYGTDWGSYCDQHGKAVYYSTKPVFDEDAVLVEDGIALGLEHYTLPKGIPEGVYFFSVAEARNGKVLNVSCPVMASTELLTEVTGMTAKIVGGNYFCLEINIPESSSIASLVPDALQLMVKDGSAEEIYVVDASYAGGVATLIFDCTKLTSEGTWYDLLICWNGTVVVDVPEYFGGTGIISTGEANKDGIIYKIEKWSSILKVTFETEPVNANSILESYSFSFDSESESLVANVTLKEGVEAAPVLAITAGDKNIIASCKGVKNDDGSYTYTLAVQDALTEAGKWYDLRFFVGKVAHETYKSEGITGENYSAKYQCGGRVYDFQSWNDLLKLQFNPAS